MFVANHLNLHAASSGQREIIINLPDFDINSSKWLNHEWITVKITFWFRLYFVFKIDKTINENNSNNQVVGSNIDNIFVFWKFKGFATPKILNQLVQ